ncbi:MAG: FecR family protein [Bdellovibrionales bacterium]|nr:FecR family protein [Bdellovibrionales bacterium]
MNRLLLVLFTTIFLNLSFAEDIPSALVHKIVGSVTLDGVLLKQGDVIAKPGVVETKEKSLVQLKIAKWENSITIGANSKMTLNLNEEKKYTLDSGLCRWKSDVKEALKKKANGAGKIFTRQVSMGVRGTDFLVTVNPVLGESEIIMFDGSVEMSNLEDTTNTVMVTKGQWGGLGGRFGKKIAAPLDLPPTLLATFEKIIEAP